MDDEADFRFMDPEKLFADTAGAVVEFEERFLILERAHAALALATGRALGNVLGWSDDDLTAFLVRHAEQVRSMKDRLIAPLAPGPLPDLLDRVARDLAVE